MHQKFEKSAVILFQYVCIFIFCTITYFNFKDEGIYSFMPLNFFNNAISVWDYLIAVSIHFAFILIFGFIALITCCMFYKCLKKSNNLGIFTIILSVIAPFLSLITYQAESVTYHISGIAAYCVIIVGFFIVLIAKNPMVIKKKAKE